MEVKNDTLGPNPMAKVATKKVSKAIGKTVWIWSGDVIKPWTIKDINYATSSKKTIYNLYVTSTDTSGVSYVANKSAFVTPLGAIRSRRRKRIKAITRQLSIQINYKNTNLVKSGVYTQAFVDGQISQADFEISKLQKEVDELDEYAKTFSENKSR